MADVQPITNVSLIDGVLAANAGAAGLQPVQPQSSSSLGTNISNLAPINNSPTVTTNPNYRIMLQQNGTNLLVIGNAPQDFEMQLHNEFIDIMHLIDPGIGNSGNIGTLFEGGVKTVKSITAIQGVSLARALSLQVWASTAPMEFTVPLSFRAIKDPLADVMQPLITLIQMGSPLDGGTGGGAALLNSPAPSPKDIYAALQSGSTSFQMLKGLNKAITMFMGQNIIVPGLVMTGLGIKMGTRAHRATSLPMAVEVTVSLRGVVSYSQQDILSMFNLSNKVASLISQTTQTTTATTSQAAASTDAGSAVLGGGFQQPF
jgi:hypothetical protein